MPKQKKRRLNIRIKQSARITEKRDKVSVVRPDTLRKAPTEVPSNGIVFKVKVKKK